MDKHDTVGIDLVAMCVNDIVVQGAEPLYFLDYLATGKVSPDQVEAIVKGIASGCQQAGAALIGGETAEMPDMYETGDYDLAGFAVGAVEKSRLITGEKISIGDILIGLPSSGVHSNGFSLVRKIINTNNIELNQQVAALGCSVGEALLEPTRIYVLPVLHLLKAVDVHGISHITGGGFDENIPRMLPNGCGVKIDTQAIKLPPIFEFLQQQGALPRREMYNIFNMGIGMVIAISPDDVTAALAILAEAGEAAVVIGEVIPSETREIVLH
jgi:phosphoribosylformylglycinamidine cyclo-ligase